MEPKKHRFNFPTRIVFGEGVLADLPAEVKALGHVRPLVVTDRGLARTDIPGRMIELLRDAGLSPELFDKVEPNPTDAQVDEGARAFNEHEADAIVALGGGSPLDAAKGIQLRIHHDEPLEEYDDLLGGDEKITRDLPQLVAVPTTAGTGSEVSRSAVITVAAAERKVVLFSPLLMPSVALCDPELTYGLPPRITAETGMDALSHSLEAFCAKGYHPMADAIALKGMALVATNLARAVKHGDDVRARRQMLMASTMGAVAFQKGLGVVHSLAHPLSTVSGISHGLANAIVLPHAVHFNAEALGERAAALATALGAEEATAEGASRALSGLLETLELPTRLSDAGMQEDQMQALVEKAMQDGCHQCNPRACKAEDMETILTEAF